MEKLPTQYIILLNCFAGIQRMYTQDLTSDKERYNILALTYTGQLTDRILIF